MVPSSLQAAFPSQRCRREKGRKNDEESVKEHDWTALF
jgi:hypothetical protein